MSRQVESENIFYPQMTRIYADLFKQWVMDRILHIGANLRESADYSRISDLIQQSDYLPFASCSSCPSWLKLVSLIATGLALGP